VAAHARQVLDRRHLGGACRWAAKRLERAFLVGCLGSCGTPSDILMTISRTLLQQRHSLIRVAPPNVMTFQIRHDRYLESLAKATCRLCDRSHIVDSLLVTRLYPTGNTSGVQIGALLSSTPSRPNAAMAISNQCERLSCGMTMKRGSMRVAVRGAAISVVTFALVLMVAVLHTVAGHGHASMAGVVACSDDGLADLAVPPMPGDRSMTEPSADQAAPAQCPAESPSCVAVLSQSGVPLGLHLYALAAFLAPANTCDAVHFSPRSPLPALVGLSLMQGSVLRM
jgi:hypothetical protein